MNQQGLESEEGLLISKYFGSKSNPVTSDLLYLYILSTSLYEYCMCAWV